MNAEPYLTHAIAVAPASFDSRAMLAHIYAARGDFDRARITLEQAAAEQPESAAPRTALGIVLEAAGRPRRRAGSLRTGAHAGSGRSDRVQQSRAALRGRRRRRSRPALELARNAAARLPGDADVHDTLGWVAFKAGRLTLAASELERAVALNANEPAYRKHLQEVRRAIEDARRRGEEARLEARKTLVGRSATAAASRPGARGPCPRTATTRTP